MMHLIYSSRKGSWSCTKHAFPITVECSTTSMADPQLSYSVISDAATKTALEYARSRASLLRNIADERHRIESEPKIMCVANSIDKECIFSLLISSRRLRASLHASNKYSLSETLSARIDHRALLTSPSPPTQATSGAGYFM
jgi:hypothetical protein